jgi:hypothetical protein
MFYSWSLPLALIVVGGIAVLVLLAKIRDCLKGIFDELTAVRIAINGPALSRASIGDQLEALSNELRPLAEGVEDIRLRLKETEPGIDRRPKDIAHM